MTTFDVHTGLPLTERLWEPIALCCARHGVSGEGPEFQRFGARVRYLLKDLEAWVPARRWTSISRIRSMRKRKRG